ncbi:MAG: 50S ribosomal protein L10 [Candidatus Woesearchaeota archaeon]
MAHVSLSKITKVSNIKDVMKDYPVIGLLDVEGIPASTLRVMRDKLRSHARIIMTKKRFMKIMFEDLKNDRPGIEGLSEHFRGMPALILTNENPFRIASILRKSRTPAHARPGQIAPDDIMIPKGPTAFPPGPIISELGAIGLKTGVEGGKVAVKEDSIVAKKGEPIKRKVAEVLTRLDIKPMSIGLALTAAHEAGTIYSQDILEVDESYYHEQLSAAAFESYAVALYAGIITSDTIMPLLSKAARESFLLSIVRVIPSKENIGFLVALASSHGESLGGKIVL